MEKPNIQIDRRKFLKKSLSSVAAVSAGVVPIQLLIREISYENKLF